jgi:hypothetical protein
MEWENKIMRSRLWKKTTLTSAALALIAASALWVQPVLAETLVTVYKSPS